MTTEDFSFAKMAPEFLEHINKSIPGYSGLIEKSLGISRRFVRSGTNVIDLGCSAGNLISGFQQQNAGRTDVTYIGLDIEDDFRGSWDKYSSNDLHFVVDDIRSYPGYENCSLVSSLFTLQFMLERDRLSLLKRIHNGLIDGGAVIVAEKIFANSSRLQDALTFPYYDFKLQSGFSAIEVLEKEKKLRGQMVLWNQDELLRALSDAGFSEVQIIWCNFPFIAVLAIKNSYSGLFKGSTMNLSSAGSGGLLRSVSRDPWKFSRRILREAISQTQFSSLKGLLE